MPDVLIVPTFTRPEFLWLCLDHVAACPEAPKLDIRVYVDDHVEKAPPMDEIHRVVGKFPQLQVYVQKQRSHSYPGNSHNVMTAYHHAWYGTSNYVFMVEDDVMVKPDFFSWHYAIQQKENPVVSIAMNEQGFKGYASLGVCWRRENLQLIAPHVCHAYFSNMRGYIQKTFPPMPYEYEQDGLICRLVHGKKVSWAGVPKAQHVGWYGYHRPKSQRPEGTVEDRYNAIKQVLSDETLLRQWMREFNDVQVLK